MTEEEKNAQAQADKENEEENDDLKVVMPKANKTFCQADETNTKGALVDDALDSIIRIQFVCTNPKTLHQQWELFNKSGFLELITLIELLSSYFQLFIEFCKELGDTSLLIFHIHTFDGNTHDIDG